MFLKTAVLGQACVAVVRLPLDIPVSHIRVLGSNSGIIFGKSAEPE